MEKENKETGIEYCIRMGLHCDDVSKKEQLAIDYCSLKQKQSLGQFTDHELFIIRFAFMAGYDANK